MNWTDDQVKDLKTLAGKGHSCSQIAAVLSRKYVFVTRNAVIGKAHRMGIELPGPVGGRHKTRQKRIRRLPTKRPVSALSLWQTLSCGPLPSPQETDIARVSFADLEHGMCRWIPGDPAGRSSSDKQYCGLETIPGKPYCKGHFVRAYTPSRYQANGPAWGSVPVRVEGALKEDA